MSLLTCIPCYYTVHNARPLKPCDTARPLGWSRAPPLQKRPGQPVGEGLCPSPTAVEKASQSLRPQAQIKFKAFLPAACTSAKILLGSQTCERKRVRCGEPQPFQTRAQRSGSRLRACQKYFFDKLRPCLPIWGGTAFSLVYSAFKPYSSARAAKAADATAKRAPTLKSRCRAER